MSDQNAPVALQAVADGRVSADDGVQYLNIALGVLAAALGATARIREINTVLDRAVAEGRPPTPAEFASLIAKADAAEARIDAAYARVKDGGG